MKFDFLLIFYTFGILLAIAQDIKRREIDNWLNYLLLSSGIIFITLQAIFLSNINLIFNLLFIIAVTLILENLLYYSKFFGGGDAKLLLAISPLFVSETIKISSINLIIFLSLLLFSGAIYGLIYLTVIYFKNFKKLNKEIRKQFKKTQQYITVAGGLILIIGFFTNSFVILFGSLILIYPILMVVAQSIEKIAFIKKLNGSKLREGDWITKDIQVNGKTIKKTIHGLTKQDLKLLKNKKQVIIKEGLPFAPSFIIALLISVFFKNRIINLFF